MTKGKFIRNTPLITVKLGWGAKVKSYYFVLDTGFTGSLQVTPLIAHELDLQTTGVAKVCIADGSIVSAMTAEILASMEGKIEAFEVLISGKMSLAGISFLTKFGYAATVDCKKRKVVLRRD